MPYRMLCRACRRDVDEGPTRTTCPGCDGLLHFDYAPAAFPGGKDVRSLWRYRARLPVKDGTRPVTLEEGFTPLLPIRGPGGFELYVKNETRNPTGSHKDRGLTVGITKAAEFGCDTVMLFSDGSTALASAAYAARAGLRCVIVVPAGAPDLRLLPLSVFGAHVLDYQGTPGEALDWTRRACREFGLFETSTYRRANPYEAEAPRTIAFEIFEQLGRAPDWLVCPVGGGGTLAAIGQGFGELRAAGLISRVPRLVGVAPAGYTALESAFRSGATTDAELRSCAPREGPDTLQVKTAHTYPPDGLECLEAVRRSDGFFASVPDAETLAALRKLGAAEGVYGEPSSTVSVAVLDRLLGERRVREGETAVAVVTGSGFRETGTILGRVPGGRIPVSGDSGLRVVERLLSTARG